MNKKNNFLLLTIFPFILIFNLSFAQCSNESLDIELDEFISNQMSLHNFPGLSAAIVKNDKVVWNSFYGYSSLEENSIVNAQTKFTLASSNNKKVVSVSVLELLKRAKIAYQNQQLEQVKLLLDQGLQLDPFHFELLQLASQVTKNKGIEAIVKMREKIVEKK